MTHHIDLDSITLKTGSHEEGSGEGCLLEWTAIFAGVPYSDSPICTSPVLGAFGRAWNDTLPDDTRQRLVPFIPRLVGTAGDGADEVRAWMAMDWLVRVFTVTWLRKAGLTARADELAVLPAFTSSELARAAQPIIDKARAEASAAGDAAWDAAWAAAWDAARAAARVAAWDAAGDAARAAAGDAAWDAARAAAKAAARDAAKAAARVAAWDAAWDAARAAALDVAWDAAGDAASKHKTYDAQYKAARSVMDEALRETTAELNESAFDLFDRMIDAKAPVAA